MREYALSKSPYKVGEIIQDDCIIIKIEEIEANYCFIDEPECVYIGTVLGEDLKPVGNKKKDGMSQWCVKKKLN